MEIIVQTCDGITGFKERGPKPVRTEAYPAEMGFINAKTGAWQQQERTRIFPTGNLPEPELGVIWKARNLSAYLCKRGLRTGQGQHDCVREMWESFLSSTHALCFACLFGALVVSVRAQSFLTPTSYLHPLYAVVSVCHELGLYLGISLIRGRTSLLLWDTPAVGNLLAKLISTGVTSYMKKDITKTTSSKCQWNPPLICLPCDFGMRWEGHVIKGYVLKAMVSIDPHQLQVLRAQLSINILLKTCLLSTRRGIY